MYRIILADDEKIVTDSITMVINRNFPGLFEIQTAKNGRYLIEAGNSFHPDIVIADIQMPGIPGVIIGALLLGIINMGMSILGIGDSWQYVVKGAVLLVAVIFSVVFKQGKN